MNIVQNQNSRSNSRCTKYSRFGRATGTLLVGVGLLYGCVHSGDPPAQVRPPTDAPSRFEATSDNIAAALDIGVTSYDQPTDSDVTQTKPGSATTSSRLRPEQHRQYLIYYAPILFKEADESFPHRWGYDWVTSFDFDRDNRYSNNRTNWNRLHAYVEASLAGQAPPPGMERWAIRPTLYTSVIEFTSNDRKSLILLYHVYHAAQEGAIHDWERIEIRLDDVQGNPGQEPEQLNYVVITAHNKHTAKRMGSRDLNFMETDTGRHLMVWQAKWSNAPVFGRAYFRKAELHFVEDDFAKVHDEIRRNDGARLNLSGNNERGDINYVFVCRSSEDAVRYWQPERINHANAGRMAARRSHRDDWSHVPKIQYELQDIADIVPSQWSGGGGSRHWQGPLRRIFIDEPVDAGPSGVIPAGLHTFYQDTGDDRRAYLGKSWFWGAYRYAERGSFQRSAFSTGAPGGTRGVANNDPDSHDNYWYQHDYFAHSGENGNNGELGEWLPFGWHRASQGGFDGRWVQLFPDD